MKGKTMFPTRLIELRKSNGLTQQALAEELIKFGYPTSVVMISAYENGRRYPTITGFMKIAQYFNVSLDYLTGLDDVITIKTKIKKKPESELVEPDILIDSKEYKKYNNHPVYMVPSQKENIEPRWGIMDYNQKRVVLIDRTVPLTTEIRLFRYKPFEAQYIDCNFKVPMSSYKLENLEDGVKVWVEMQNAEPFIKGEYNGWYTHNENHTCIINKANGLTLPYSGCGISYNAYLF